MTVTSIQPRVALNQLEEIEKIADAMELLIEEETDRAKREAKLGRLNSVKEQIEAKKATIENEIGG